jgi:hypothetical protein
LVGYFIEVSDTRSELTIDYVVFPDVLTKPTIYTLSQKNGGPVSVDVAPYGLVIPLIAWLSFGFGCVVAWVKSRSRIVT